jgi:hypothetical protein
MRHIGVDLHKTNFVACFIEDGDTRRLETYPLTRDGLARFKGQLNTSDELAVEATQNVHYFYDQVKGHVARVAVVETYRFGVIAKSKKKTDKADAAALARFLKLGWLPEVPVPSEQVRTLRQLLQARETLVLMRTKLKNMAHAAFSRNGVALTRSALLPLEDSPNRMSSVSSTSLGEKSPKFFLIAEGSLFMSFAPCDADDGLPYCSSLTFSIHSTALPLKLRQSFIALSLFLRERYALFSRG